ncbi:MAG: gluconate 2-dehydrogenase subunit 3 family protein [Gemmatimonadaceae bacterium]
MTAHESASDYLPEMINRREAMLRVTALLGGVALVGGSALLTGCSEQNTDAPFTADEIAFLDEVAETILPQTGTPGAKAAKVGAFMALIVTDSYSPRDRKAFRKGMEKLDQATRRAHDVSFMAATQEQRLAVLQVLDREQKLESDARKKESLKKAEVFLADERKDRAPGSDAGVATEITADPPAHYFRMMKELALLGYFTSEIGCTQGQRYVESPGRFDPCVPHTPGEKAWAPHA